MSGGQPLPKSVQNFFEPRFGYDFSQVRVHTDTRAAKSAQAVNARAYTTGRDIVFGAGQYKPQNSEGKWLLAHELAHIMQQKAINAHVMKQSDSASGDRRVQRKPAPKVPTFKDCTKANTLTLRANEKLEKARDRV